MTTNRKRQINTQINKFLRANKIERRNFLTFGTEIEYQLGSGNGCECDSEYLYNYDALSDDSAEAFGEHWSQDYESDDLTYSDVQYRWRDIAYCNYWGIKPLINWPEVYKAWLADSSLEIREFVGPHLACKVYTNSQGGRYISSLNEWLVLYDYLRTPKFSRRLADEYYYLSVDCDSCSECHDCDSGCDDDCLDKLERSCGRIPIDSFTDLLQVSKFFTKPENRRSSISDLFEEVYGETYRQDWEDNADMSYYEYEDHECYSSKDIELSNPKTERVEDQSVSGGEVRTIGGLKYNEIIEVASDIFSDVDDAGGTFDTNCSAHIHLKLGDIRHVYGNGILHYLMLEYLTLNIHKLPRSVRQRLRSGGNRWIGPDLDNRKFNHIHFHSQGTIEFRLFGNVSNTDDFQACLDFAIEMLRYAYKIRKTRSKTLSSSADARKKLEYYTIFNSAVLATNLLKNYDGSEFPINTDYVISIPF